MGDAMQRTIPARKRGISRQLKTDLIGYAFIAPNVLGFTLFTLVPMIISLIISFTDWDYTQGFGKDAAVTEICKHVSLIK